MLRNINLIPSTYLKNPLETLNVIKKTLKIPPFRFLFLKIMKLKHK